MRTLLRIIGIIISIPFLLTVVAVPILGQYAAFGLGSVLNARFELNDGFEMVPIPFVLIALSTGYTLGFFYLLSRIGH